MQTPILWHVCVLKLEHRSHHAGVDCSLLYITGDAGHKCIPVFKVCVKISLRKKREKGVKRTWKMSKQLEMMVGAGDSECTSVYLVHDRGGRGFDAWLLVWEGQLLQQVHIGQGILQGHVGRHGNKASLTQNPSLTEIERERART